MISPKEGIDHNSLVIRNVFSNTILSEYITVCGWLEANGFTIDDVRKELNYELEHLREQNERQERELRAELKNNPRFSEVIRLCKKCDKILRIVESAHPNWETDLLCPCGHVEHLDVSPVDYNMQISAALREEEPDFTIDELRAKKEVRMSRRHICNTCEFLDGRRCKKCGCSAKHRTYYKILTCPVGKW